MRIKKLLATILTGTLLLPVVGIPEANAEVTQVKINETQEYQTMESFGGSGAWWTQYAGLWDTPYLNTGRTAREQLATLLYDRNWGIGLTNYRYNIGAGSADSGKGDYSDVNRRAQSFETEAGVYDWSKDEGAVWFMQETVRLGAEEVVLFFNSPIERLTKNGMAHMTAGGERTNIDPANYGAWAIYACDVAEHFVDMGIPVRFISPINEPQWDWTGGQEGCHYEPEQIAAVYVAFLKELEKRPKLAGVELSGPESGEWGGKTPEYVSALLNNQTLKEHFKAIDCHSYWSNTQSKISFRNWMDVHYPDVKIRMSEWCEMVHGTDVGMDSAIVLAKTVAEDLTVLNAVSWATWVEVSPGGYHDGLIHATENGSGEINIVPLKRLWAYGNYTRYIRPGFKRVELTGAEEFSGVAFHGEEYGKKKLVVVLVNDSNEEKNVKLSGHDGCYERIVSYETSAGRDLVQTSERVANTAFVLTPMSVTTIVFSE